MRPVRRLAVVSALTAAFAAAGVADARPIAVFDVAKEALDAFCTPMLQGEGAAATVTSAEAKGWAFFYGDLHFKEGFWGRVNAARSIGPDRCTVVVPAGSAKDAKALEVLSYAEAWAGQNGLVAQGPRSKARTERYDTTSHSFASRDGRFVMKALAYTSKPEGVSIPDVEIYVQPKG